MVGRADDLDPSGQRADQRQPAGLAEHEAAGGSSPRIRSRSRESASGAAWPAARRWSRTDAQNRSVAPRASGQSYIGSAAMPPVTPLGRRVLRRRGPDRMRHRVLAVQQVAAEDLAVRAVAVAAVPPEPLLAAARELAGQAVPGQARVGVVYGVVVVVEEEQRQRAAVLDDYAARAGPLMGLVLEEGPDPQDREPQPAGDEIGRDRDAAGKPEPERHRHDREAVQQPGAGDAPVAAAREREVAPNEVGHADERPDQHPPEQRVVRGEHRPRPAAAAAPRPPGRGSSSRDRRAGRSATGRDGARGAGRGTARRARGGRAPGRPGRRSAAGMASDARGSPRAAATNAAPAGRRAAGPPPKVRTLRLRPWPAAIRRIRQQAAAASVTRNLWPSCALVASR